MAVIFFAHTYDLQTYPIFHFDRSFNLTEDVAIPLVGKEGILSFNTKH